MAVITNTLINVANKGSDEREEHLAIRGHSPSDTYAFSIEKTMSHPLNVLRYLLQGKSPSSMTDMQAVPQGFWLRPGFAALTFFGTILTATRHEADRLNSSYTVMKNHEMIHLRQAQSTHDSWCCFYARYLWYSLRALPQRRRLPRADYWLNPFEMEAYHHEEDFHYVEQTKAQGAQEWKLYARMSQQERLALYRERQHQTK